MEPLKTLAMAVAFSLVFAAGVTLLMSWLMEPLERMRQQWLERERQAVKEARTSA